MSRISLDPSWHSRRQVVRVSLLSCLLLALYSIHSGEGMAAIVFPNVSLLAAGIIAAYIGGASYERACGVPSFNKYRRDERGPEWRLPEAEL